MVSSNYKKHNNEENIVSSSNANKKIRKKHFIFKNSLLKSIVSLSLVPIVTLGITIIIIINILMVAKTDKEVINSLKGTAQTVLIAFNQNPGDYYIGEDKNLWKGSFNVNRSGELLESIAGATDVDIAVYSNDTCMVCIDEKKHIEPKAVKKIVIDNKKDYTSIDYNISGVSSYICILPIINERTEEVMGMISVSVDRQSRLATSYMVTKYTMIVVVSLITIVGFIAIFIARALVISLRDGISSIKELSDGYLYIEFKEKHIKRSDEVGGMYKSLYSLAQNLRKMIARTIIQSKKIIMSSQKLDNTASKTKESIEQVNMAMETMSDTAIAQSNTSEKVVNNIGLLKKMIENTYSEIQQLNSTKHNMETEGKRVNKVIANLTYINSSLNEIIDVINTQVETTYKSATKIKESAEQISEFADETNLLALNAAIEAARVGEQGKGFAIVASEIKQLADQSNTVSLNISKDIEELVIDSNKSMESMEKVNAIIDKLNENISTTEDVFVQINIGIDDVSDRVVQIEGSVNKMEDASAEIWNITEELKEISRKNSECASNTTSVKDYMTELFEEAQELKKVSDDLAECMRAFKL